ncbi:bis(5'-nucleosyl)-tetraphosphatase, symmetrical [Betaproteobacteria bacterium]|nr:bis(5'-nucleosyl)-tetraphosphatase, symmetrical [Betaproteobacteria bacterium]GHU19976.1 bis(5'-nucleosyl)-tetraphosphatase, symmetrical [Betaproteobacteria bacterium]
MATYAIGDLQGCYSAFRRLLDQCAFDPARDRLWLVGDLVNRGPESLEVLRFVSGLGSAVTAVLGNHDLYLLMLAAGVKRRASDDTLLQVLEAPDCDSLLRWLSTLPLLHVEGEHVLVHAGLLPQWSVPQALALAEEVGGVLAGKNSKKLLRNLLGDQPDAWNDELKGWSRLRVIVNALTRMRFCTVDGHMAMRAKGPPESASRGTLPWFALPQRKSRTHTIVCGHWSALGFYRRDGLIALDSGYVWGGKLTAVRIEDGEVFQVPAN